MKWLFYLKLTTEILSSCLKIEVPFSFYELSPNGTFFQYIHEQNEEFSIIWEMCIAIDVQVLYSIYN